MKGVLSPLPKGRVWCAPSGLTQDNTSSERATVDLCHEHTGGHQLEFKEFCVNNSDMLVGVSMSMKSGVLVTFHVFVFVYTDVAALTNWEKSPIPVKAALSSGIYPL